MENQYLDDQEIDEIELIENQFHQFPTDVSGFGLNDVKIEQQIEH